MTGLTGWDGDIDQVLLVDRERSRGFEGGAVMVLEIRNRDGSNCLLLEMYLP